MLTVYGTLRGAIRRFPTSLVAFAASLGALGHVLLVNGPTRGALGRVHGDNPIGRGAPVLLPLCPRSKRRSRPLPGVALLGRVAPGRVNRVETSPATPAGSAATPRSFG